MGNVAPPAGFQRKILACFLPFAAGYFLSFLFRTVNVVIGPDLLAEFGLDASGLGVLTGAYFAAFALFQLPGGVLLDRFGPRRVVAAMLVAAAIGALVFALAGTVLGLAAGRALIGLGVSCCLMAAFKANVQFWPHDRLPLMNGWIMAFGGLGAAAATLPLEWLLLVSDWRRIFAGLAGVTVVVSAYILRAVPEQGGSASGLGESLAGLARIYRAPEFWRVAPVAISAQAGLLAYQGLWAGPWLSDVALFEREAVAATLFLIQVGMMAGFLLTGIVADRLGRAGIRPATVMAWLIGLFLAVQAPLALNYTGASALLWPLFGVLGTGSVVCFAYLTQSFPAELAGRVNTGLNFLVFSAAFLAQWGVGAIIDLFPPAAAGFSPAGHRAAFLIVLALEAAGFGWFLWPRRPRG
ncbi:MAG: MFS transporter [Pseudomonadota bacterium]